jgi:hypothetical protein
VKNNVRLRGSSSVNGNDPDGPDVPGVYATGEVDLGGSATVSGSPNSYMDAVDNDPSLDDGRSAPNYFDQPGHTITEDQLAILKMMAKNNTSCVGGCYFNTDKNFPTLPDGVVVVDTKNGGWPITPDNKVKVKVNGTNSPSKTWLIVLGDVEIQGSISIEGLIYAFGAVDLRGFGSGSGILGAIVGLSEATVDATVDVVGNSKVNFSLKAASTPPTNSLPYLVMPGSWRQIRQ